MSDIARKVENRAQKGESANAEQAAGRLRWRGRSCHLWVSNAIAKPWQKGWGRLEGGVDGQNSPDGV